MRVRVQGEPSRERRVSGQPDLETGAEFGEVEWGHH